MSIPSNLPAPEQPNMHEQADHVKKECSASKASHSPKTDMEAFLNQKSKSRVYKPLDGAKSRLTKIFTGTPHQKLP